MRSTSEFIDEDVDRVVVYLWINYFSNNGLLEDITNGYQSSQEDTVNADK